MNRPVDMMTSSESSQRVKSAMVAWMQEIAPFGIFTTDQELRVISWNEWLVRHSNLSTADVLGRKLSEIFSEFSDRRLSDRYAHALGGEISVLSTALHKFLLPFPVTVPESGLPHMLQTARIAPLREGDAIVGTITIIEDVTQREFQAGILHRQQELDRLLSSSLAMLLQSQDPAKEMAGIFATISPALGLDAHVSYLLGDDGVTLHLNTSGGISPKQRESISVLQLSEQDQRVLHSGLTGPALQIESHADALHRMGLRGYCTFSLAVGTSVMGMVSFGSYVREVIADADINVLSRIARYVSIALDRAIRESGTIAASRAKDDFLAALSHDLRTPLNPVLLIASDAAENPEYPLQAREDFRVIEKNALLEARLIDDLLDLTRIEHGKLSLEIQMLDVHAALVDALETLQVELKEHGLSLHINLQAKEHTSMGDGARLQQVFWNIIKNAVKFTPPGGQIWVSSEFDANTSEIVVRITDTGIGMDANELGRVFGAFSQGDHALRGRSHRFGGLGLGLAISRKLLDLHGGRITAESTGKEKGSTFTIRLHTVSPHPGADSLVNGISPERIHASSVTTNQSREGSCVLLVEDHEPTRTSLANLLKRRGYEVTAVASMTAALNEASQRHFSLVLSDIGLPDGDGFGLMRQLRELHGLRGIALTGYGMEEDLVRSREAGFLAHLTKPVNVKVLDRVLATAFDTPPAER